MSSIWPYPGSRWWKFDFHTHTPASKDTPWHDLIGSEGALTPEDWLLKYMAAEIDCVAVTDHNSGAWIDQLKAAYAAMQANPPAGFRELHLFPGVEISVNGGFHLLAVFGAQTTTSDIDTLLGAVKYQDTKGDSDGVTREAAAEVIQAIVAAGGLPIPAHADCAKGLLQLEAEGGVKPKLDANTVAQVLESNDILAMEFVNADTSKPAIYTQRKLKWAEVLGSDCHNFRAPYPNVPGSRYTWVKMATPSLEGLRLALLDGNGVSIRRSDEEAFDPFKTPEHFITSITVKDARAMGRNNASVLKFSPYFNALVGGRGTGKSTVIHALRLASGRTGEINRLDEKSEPRQTFEQFVKVSKNRDDRGGLLEQTAVALELYRDAVPHRLTWQQNSAQAVTVEEHENGEWKRSISQEVSPQRFPLRIFSQGQIAALAGENTLALLGVIDEAAETQSAKNSFEEAKRNYLAQRAKLRELDGRLKANAEIQRQFHDVERKLKTFEKADHADVLKAYQRARQQNQAVQEQFQSADDIAQKTQSLAQEMAIDVLHQESFDAQADADVLGAIAALNERVLVAQKAVDTAVSQLSTSLNALRQDPGLLSWKQRIEAAKQAYEKLKADLLAQGVNDPNEYARLVQEKQRLEGESKKMDLLQQERDRLVMECEVLWLNLSNARKKISATRETFLGQVLAQNDFVRIDLVPFGKDARTVERSLREMLDVMDERFVSDILDMDGDTASSGLVADWLVAADSEIGLSTLKDRLVEACGGGGTLGGKFKNYLQRKGEAHPEFIDHIRCWFPEDSLLVNYSRKGDGTDFQPIGQASAGQRAAAMLAFLLAQGAEPLVLDQPEDDLDNHLIYELVVRQIRENKLRRQLIIVTHNPNIVVNGDAEMLFALDFNGQCFVKTEGALQQQNVRDEVCRIMEGGREAFSRRWHRLGRGLS